MDIPMHLKHKPILKLENYFEIDGKHANDTDAEGLSVGIAQWSNNEYTELSAKVWRYTGEKWSRQSEELPIHRVIDLATLVCSAISYAKTDVLLTDEKFNITATKDKELLKSLKDEIQSDLRNLAPSLQRLAKILRQLGY